MSLEPTYFLVGLVWRPCLQGGRSQEQVPADPVTAMPAGQWWEEGEPQLPVPPALLHIPPKAHHSILGG